MKKRMIFIFILFLLLFINGCSIWDINFNFTTSPQTTLSTTLPTIADGTMTILNNQYDSYAKYTSPSYSITDVNEYNDVLIATRDKIRKSNVQVVATIYHYSSFFPYSTVVDSTMSGSGVIFKADDTYYYVVTNEHVINNQGKLADFHITLFGTTQEKKATLLVYDEDLDLAVLKVPKGTEDNIEIMDLSTRVFHKYNTGEMVLAVGNPLSVVNNVTFGEFLGMMTISNASYKVIYHNAMIHEGSSGGALTDIDGHFLGINTWGSENSDEESFAIPSDIVYMFLYNHGFFE